MHKRLIKTGLALASLAVVALIAAECVRRSDLPRDLVLQALRSNLNAHVTLDRLTVTWSGHTELAGLRISDPLTGQPIASFPTIHATHASLPRLLITRSPHLQKIEILRGQLHLTEDAHGAWNLARALEPLLNTDAPADAPTTLPELVVTDLAINAVRHNGRSFELNALNAHLHPQPNAPRADLTIHADPIGTITGTLAHTGDWAHDIEMDLPQLTALSALWTDGPGAPHALKARWTGRLADAQLVGRLDIADAQLNPVTLSGQADLTLDTDTLTITITPRRLQLDQLPNVPGPFVLIQGHLVLADQHLRADRLEFQAFGGRFTLDAHADLQSQRGDASLAWRGVACFNEPPHDGQASLQWNPDGPDRYTAHTDYQLNAVTPDAHLTARGDADLEWTPTTHLTAAAHLQQLLWQHPSASLDLSGLELHGTADPHALRIDAIRLPGRSDLTGSAHYEPAARSWQLELTGAQLPLTHPDLQPTRFQLTATGDADAINVQRLLLDDDNHTLVISGDWQPRRDTPVQATVTVTQANPLRLEKAGATFQVDHPAFDGRVAGSARPLALTIDGQLTARALHSGRHRRPHWTLPVTGELTPDHLSLTGRAANLLNGIWQFDTHWRRRDNTLTAKLRIAEVALERFDDLSEHPLNLHGTLSGALDVTLPRLDPARLEAAGHWRVDRPAWRNLHADAATGQLLLQNDRLTLQDVQLHRADGSAQAQLTFDLDDQRAHANLTLSRWPLRHPQSATSATLDAHADLAIDPATISVTGPINVAATILTADEQLADLRLAGNIDRRRLVLDQISGSCSGAQLTGSAVADLDHPDQSRLSLSLLGFEPARLANLWPRATDAQGRIDAQLDLQHPDTPHPPGPIQATLTLQGHDAAFRGIALREADATAYLAPTTTHDQARLPSLDRLLLLRSHWRLDHGDLELWGRLTKRDHDWYYLLQTDLQHADLTSLSRALIPNGEEAPVGKLTGSIMLTGPLGDRLKRYGRASLTVANADLANEGLIAGIYNLLNLDLNPQPTGSGTADIQLTGDQLTIHHLQYHNRGLRMDLGGQLADVSKGRKTPISGYAAVVSLVLPDARVLAPINKTLGAVQGLTNAVRFTGTWDDPHLTWVPLENAVAEVRNLVPQ